MSNNRLELNQALYDRLPKRLIVDTRRQPATIRELHNAIALKPKEFYSDHPDGEIIKLLAKELGIGKIQLQSYFYILDTSVEELRTMTHEFRKMNNDLITLTDEETAKKKFEQRYAYLCQFVNFDYKTDELYDTPIPVIQIDTDQLPGSVLRQCICVGDGLDHILSFFNFYNDSFHTMLENKNLPSISEIKEENRIAKFSNKKNNFLSPFVGSFYNNNNNNNNNNFISPFVKPSAPLVIKSCMTADNEYPLNITKLANEEVEVPNITDVNVPRRIMGTPKNYFPGFHNNLAATSSSAERESGSYSRDTKEKKHHQN